MSEIPPGLSSELPDVDERLVAPESRYEIIDGQVVYVPPAREPHATSHVSLAAIVKAHAADGFTTAADMLTRTSRIDDIAPDVSVFPSARTEAGGRQLEHLAFEIASTQTISNAAIKARKLSNRGVRRVFALDLSRQRVLEWSREMDGWSIMDLQGAIVDPALAVPMPLAPLLDAAQSDDAILEAWRARRHRAFEAERIAGHREGHREGLREGILRVLAARGFSLTREQEARVLGEEDVARLGRWLERATRITEATSLFADE
jgi:Uma2 family endonuclease